MNHRRRLRHGGWILLSAASLPGCGALALDRLAQPHRQEAQSRAERSIALARSSQREAAEAERSAARAALDRAIASAEDPVLLTELLATRYQFDAGSGDRAQAARTLSRLTAIAPDSPVTAMIAADAHAVAKDLEAAQGALDHALRFTPLAPELLWLSGIVALERADLAHAEARFAALATAGSDDPVWTLSGRMARALARHGTAETKRDAVGEWREALASDATQTGFRLVIDELGSRAPGLETRLRALCDEASVGYQDDAAVAFAKAYVDRASGFPERSLDEIDRILSRGAGDLEVDLLWLACQAHRDLDQPEAAVVRARVLLDRRPWHVEALVGFVEGVLRSPDSGPDRERALGYVKDARAHFEGRRRRIVEEAGRESPELRARLAENDRYLALLDQMTSALESR